MNQKAQTKVNGASSKNIAPEPEPAKKASWLRGLFTWLEQFPFKSYKIAVSILITVLIVFLISFAIIWLTIHTGDYTIAQGIGDWFNSQPLLWYIVLLLVVLTIFSGIVLIYVGIRWKAYKKYRAEQGASRLEQFLFKSYKIIAWIWVTVLIVFLISFAANLLTTHSGDHITAQDIVDWLKSQPLRWYIILPPAVFTLFSGIVFIYVGFRWKAYKEYREKEPAELNLSQLINSLEKIAGSLSKSIEHQSSAETPRDLYVHMVKATCHMTRVDDHHIAAEVPLESVFEPPLLREMQRPDRIDWSYTSRDSASLSTAEIQDPEVIFSKLDANHPAAVICGLRGIGKTTLFHHLAGNMAKDYLDGTKDRIPLLIDLDTYALANEKETHSFDQFLYLTLQFKNNQFTQVVLDALWEGNCCVFFDGLERVSSTEQRQKIMASISTFITEHNITRDSSSMRNQFLNRLERISSTEQWQKIMKSISTLITEHKIMRDPSPSMRNQFLITVPLAGYHPTSFLAYRHFELLRLKEDEQIRKNFVDRWQNALLKQYSFPIPNDQITAFPIPNDQITAFPIPNDQIISPQITAFLNMLQNTRTLRPLSILATWPSFLACMAIAFPLQDWLSGREDILYFHLLKTTKLYIEDLLLSRNLSVLAALTKLAGNEQGQGDGFTKDHIQQICMEVIKEQSQQALSKKAQRKAVDQLVSSLLQSDLLMPSKNGVTFTWREFKTYFRSCFLCRASSDDLKKYAGQEDWQDALFLLTGMLQASLFEGTVNGDTLLEILIQQAVVKTMSKQGCHAILEAVHMQNFSLVQDENNQSSVKIWEKAHLEARSTYLLEEETCLLEEETLFIFVHHLNEFQRDPSVQASLSEKIVQSAPSLEQEQALLLILAILYTQKIASVEVISPVLLPFRDLASISSIDLHSLNELHTMLDHGKIHQYLCERFQKERRLHVLLALSAMSSFAPSFSEEQLKHRLHILQQAQLEQRHDDLMRKLIDFSLKMTNEHLDTLQKEEKDIIEEKDEKTGE